MSKRLKFFLVSTLLGVFLWLSNFFSIDHRFGIVLAISALSYVLSAWVLFEDLKGMEWLTLLVSPVLFTLGAGLFANMLPGAVPRIFGFDFQIESSIFLANLIRFLFYCLYVLGMYAALLTENIFSVASIRTIQLFRAARSVSFIMTLIISLFFFVVIYSLRLPFWVITPSTFLVSLLLSYANLWSIDLKMERVREVKQLSLIIAWLMAIYGTTFAFWPARPFMAGLALTSCFYALLGILEQRLLEKLSPLNYMEFVSFNLIVVATTFLTTSWLG